MRNAVRSLRRRCCLRPAGGAATAASRRRWRRRSARWRAATTPPTPRRCARKARRPVAAVCIRSTSEEERGRGGLRLERPRGKRETALEGDGGGLHDLLPNRWRTETVADSESASEDSSQAGRCVADSVSAGHATSTMKGWRGGPGDYGSLGHRLGEGRASEGRAGQTGAKAVFLRSFIICLLYKVRFASLSFLTPYII